MSSQSKIPSKIRAYNVVKTGNGFSENNLKLVEISSPPAPEADEVLVKVHAVSLNYRDLLIAWGKYSLAGIQGSIVPASDAACEIVAVGPKVKGWSVGQRVCANFCPDHIFGDVTADARNGALGAAAPGVLTEYRTFPAHSLVEIPEHLSYEEASTLPCAALTAYNALVGSKPIKGGQTVLVQGTGGVSIFALQLAVASGAVVIATSSSDKKLELALKLGATHLINYNKTPNWDEEVLRITKGKGVDHVIEVGGAGTLERSLKSVKIGGSVDIIGIISASETPPANVVGLVMVNAIHMRGILIGSVDQFRDMNRLLSAHKIKPVVDKVFEFEQAVDAYKYLESQKHVGKVVIKVAKN
ncbi:alcohol dehydrogenase superfamily protein [Pterulicium gracile]|uniref:Alcohol dehydrogenase superfamily protein n=1 Tax=Pterulicium gracile TaxID=1884261 RepID=A0A5C3QT15_9AGAR|nr:alcohol dehydrogenase superfamily protein [Pterula gracilis]